jgi:hypothetical protein
MEMWPQTKLGRIPMKDHQAQAAFAFLEDHRRLIAAGKLLRWDVVKWAVTVNIALGAAAAAFKQTTAGSQLVCLAEIVAGVGWLLMLYYNWRLTKTREDAEKTAKYLTSQGVDFAVIRGRERKKVTLFYDWQELLIFTVILFGSILPVALVSKLATGTN